MSETYGINNVPIAITVVDTNGVILEMNDKSGEAFQENGGKTLIGTNILDCHPEPSRSKLERLLKSKEVNCYTIEKEGVKKLIYQVPWYENKEYRGYIEMILELPSKVPHYQR